MTLVLAPTLLKSTSELTAIGVALRSTVLATTSRSPLRSTVAAMASSTRWLTRLTNLATLRLTHS